MQEVVGSNPASPIVFRNEAFGEDVDRPSHFKDESCAVKPVIQKTISKIRRFVAPFITAFHLPGRLPLRGYPRSRSELTDEMVYR